MPVPTDTWSPIPDCALAAYQVYTWHGCRLELLASGSGLAEALESVYQAGETPMQDYVNVHGLLEQLRAGAREAGKRDGPRTFVSLHDGWHDISLLCCAVLCCAVPCFAASPPPSCACARSSSMTLAVLVY